MHLSQLKRNIHCNNYLQYSFNKYGVESFSVDVLIICTEAELIKYEEFYISKYKSSERKFGYNLDSFENGRNKKSNVQRGEKRENAKANYSVVRIIRGLYKKGERPYVKEIAEYFCLSITVTKNIINKVKWIVLDFEDLTNEEKIKIQEIKNIFDGKEYRRHLFSKITLTHKQTNEVLCFESIDSCGRYFGMHSGNIRESLKRPNSRINRIYTIKRQTNPRNSRQNKGGNKMSKLEEKFREKIESCTCQECGAIYGYNEHDKMILDSAKQCAEITEQECIGFANFIRDSCWSKADAPNDVVISMGDNHWCYVDKIEGLKYIKTTKDLFQLYQKSKENE